MTDLLRATVQCDRALVDKGTFYDYFCTAWPLIDPAPLERGWPLEEMCNHLEAVSKGEIRRLLINVPPGSGKSNTANVLWNTWEWIKRPPTKFLYASYDQSLVGTRDGGKVIRLLLSDWFVARWGRILLPGNLAASMFETVAGGFRFATSPGGKGLGRHGDIRVIDDLVKPKDVRDGGKAAHKALKNASAWMGDTWSSRATDQTTVRDVMIAQRLHEEDPPAEWLARGDCVHLSLPAMFDPERASRTQWGGDRRTQKDELLFPRRLPRDVLDKMRELDMGPDVFEAQMQQAPSRKSGGIFDRQWWQFWHFNPGVPAPCLCDKCWKAKRKVCLDTPIAVCTVLPAIGMEAQSWDCAFKNKSTSDFVAGGAFRMANDRVFLLHCINERLSFTQTVQAIRDMSARHPRAYDKLVEDKANGTAVEDVLRSEISGLTMVDPKGGKDARAKAGSIYMSSRRFFLPHPEIAPWVWPLLVQHDTFPNSVNDDAVDMVSQLLVHLRANGSNLAAFSAAMRAIRGGK